jgi:hypothetical protein
MICIAIRPLETCNITYILSKSWVYHHINQLDFLSLHLVKSMFLYGRLYGERRHC